MSDFLTFSHGHNTIVAAFGQDQSHCAAVAVAAVQEFYMGTYRSIGPINIQEFAERIHHNAASYYELALHNARNDGENDDDGLVELGYIFNSIREIDKFNVITLSPTASLSFETPLSRTLNFDGSHNNLEDYVEGWPDSDFPTILASYLKSRDNLILYSHSRRHYVAVFKFNRQFLVVDGLGRYRCIFYRDFMTMLKDLIEFRDDSVFSFHHLRHDIASQRPVDPKTISIIDNCDTVRMMIEKIIAEKAEEKGTVYQKSTSASDCCRVSGCDNVKFGKSIKESVCLFHVSIAKKFWTITNGLRCSTAKCTRKPDYGDKCCACRQDAEFQEKALAERELGMETRWSDELIVMRSRHIADSLIRFVNLHPHLQLYIGITVQPFKKRLYQHIESGRAFDEAVILLDVPNAHSLAEIEYHTILMVSNELGSRHLGNRASGGDYFIKDLARPGVVYCLFKYNVVRQTDENPPRNFVTRFSWFHCDFAKDTPLLSLTLPKFSKKPSFCDRLRKLGYNVAYGKTEITRIRDGEFKCKNCDFSTDTKKNLTTHYGNVHRNVLKCPHCPHTTSAYKSLRTHIQSVHGLVPDVKPPSRRGPLKTSFKCNFCDECFSTCSKRQWHVKTEHKDAYKCELCGEGFCQPAILKKHEEDAHGKTYTTNFKCDDCKIYFANAYNLRNHVNRKHSK